MCAMFQSFINKLASLPLASRRRFLKAYLDIPFLHQRSLGATELIMDVLRMGRQEANAVDRQMFYQDALHTLEWLALARRSVPQLDADEQHVKIANPGVFERLSAEGGTVILAPFHMGTYPLGIASVLRRYFFNRPVLVIRAQEDLEMENLVIRRIENLTSGLMVIKHDDNLKLFEGVRHVANGGVIICFADLPATYGAPAEVELFGELSQIAFGLDGLARLTRGCVVPMGVISNMAGDTVVTGQPFEVGRKERNARSEVAKLIVDSLQEFINHDPSQWHMWFRLDEYALPDEEDAIVHHDSNLETYRSEVA